MDPLSLLEKYGRDNPEFLNLIVKHSQAVAKKALEIAKKFPRHLSRELCLLIKSLYKHLPQFV